MVGALQERVGHTRYLGKGCLEDLQLLLFVETQRVPGEIPIGTRHVGDEPPFYRIATNRKHDRNGSSRLLCRPSRSRPRGNDEVDLEPNQLSREGWQLIRAVRIARL